MASVETERQESLVVISEEIVTSTNLIEYQSMFFFYLNIKVQFEYYVQLTTALKTQWSTELGVSKYISLQLKLFD